MAHLLINWASLRKTIGLAGIVSMSAESSSKIRKCSNLAALCRGI